jgi:hypothetical protein
MDYRNLRKLVIGLANPKVVKTLPFSREEFVINA